MRMRARTVGSITPSSSSCIGAGASCSSGEYLALAFFCSSVAAASSRIASAAASTDLRSKRTPARAIASRIASIALT